MRVDHHNFLQMNFSFRSISTNLSHIYSGQDLNYVVPESNVLILLLIEVLFVLVGLNLLIGNLKFYILI